MGGRCSRSNSQDDGPSFRTSEARRKKRGEEGGELDVSSFPSQRTEKAHLVMMVSLLIERMRSRQLCSTLKLHFGSKTHANLVEKKEGGKGSASSSEKRRGLSLFSSPPVPKDSRSLDIKAIPLRWASVVRHRFCSVAFLS